MQHLVIEHVLEKPRRNERLVQPRIDADDTVFFLNRAEDEIFALAFLSACAPRQLCNRADRLRKWRAFSLSKIPRRSKYRPPCLAPIAAAMEGAAGPFFVSFSSP